MYFFIPLSENIILISVRTKCLNVLRKTERESDREGNKKKMRIQLNVSENENEIQKINKLNGKWAQHFGRETEHTDRDDFFIRFYDSVFFIFTFKLVRFFLRSQIKIDRFLCRYNGLVYGFKNEE